MAVTVNLKKQVDLPVWEWMRFAPATTSATSSMCTGNSGDLRFIYYLAATFWRYDTWTDGWQQLATPPTAAVTAGHLRLSEFGGYRGNCLGATADTITIAGLEQDVFKDIKIRIMSGTGAGQERTITGTTDNYIWDNGVVTAVSANSITDSTKRWKMNEHIGKQVRLLYGTGVSQVRKVLFNDANTLYFYDANYQQLEPWNNTPLSATAPYALPVITAALQATYQIETLVATVTPSWTVQPDLTSSYVMLTGGIWLFSSVATAPWSSFQYYDIASDTWTPKTALGGQVIAAFGTDFTIERTGESGGSFDTGTATGAAARTLTASAKTWAIDRYTNYQIRITGGTGIGQRRRIVGNTASTIYVDIPWTVTPSTDSTFSIMGDTDKIYLAGNASSAVFKYSVENDQWFTGPIYDFGTCRNISCQYGGQEAWGVTTGARATTGVTAVSLGASGGTLYSVGDILTLTTGGGNCKVRVASITTGGVVASVELWAAGSGYATTASQATSGGTGTLCTITPVSVGTIGRITLASNHNLCVGDSVTFAGCSDATWNAAYTVLASDTLTTFDVITTAAGAMSASTSQGTTTIVDANKSWTNGEHIGKIVNLNVAGAAPTTQIRRITGNTANTLTVATITAGANGTSRYSIQEPFAMGRAEQYTQAGRGNLGWATSGSGTTLVDTTKTWWPGQWVGTKVRIICGTGAGQEVAITANSIDTLTGTFATAPDNTSKYIIMDTFGLLTTVTNTTNAVLTDSTKLWIVNQWAGRRVRITSGTGAGQEIVITSNTATALTCTGVFTTAPDTTSTYQIYSIPARSTGIELNWIFGQTSHPDDKGKYIICPRGGASNVFDKYNITTGTWDYSIFITPQTEVLSTGTMYVYDGVDRLYFTRDATGRVFYLDVNTHKVYPFGMTPYAHGTALLGNRMEIITTADGLEYLYIMRHTGTEMWRTLLWM